MRYWLYVDGERHVFVEAERLPQIGETVIYRTHTSTLEESTVAEIATEVIAAKSNMADPVGAIYHVKVQTKKSQ